ncbi:MULTISPECIES: nuclear transport factor 2 family protein [unclassified Pseudomonas]|uniref:nuclear transport factor 2 family protein n=1 Tax=unclassified Pseudomonas TaxID=196821 RepID=UPI0024478A7F|nr:MULTISPECIES: nuclear transport factor 2 family protein [unclassified Pseudomonas]MDG9930401.1 nuclear transport factor 2 family protein [Pseudomonas sp. GD04042]MDH0483049.1 nuclear transport factor 2 family protein [Pseudomonas sp. GD04015]MDH0605449.1 nuclear transport factor 2 family protein [Pseudomonas sp. GD03869]
MSDRQALIGIVEAAYAAFAARRSQDLLPLCAAGCLWQAPGLPNLMPWAGRHHGHAGVLEFLGQLDEHLDFLAFEARSLVVDVEQGQVMALGVGRCRVKSTGRLYVNHWAHLFTLRDGLITAFREYPDTAAQLVAIHPALADLDPQQESLHD